MGVRNWAYRFALICLQFIIAYMINLYLIFSGQPQPWGAYTGLFITFIAVIVAVIILWLSKGS